ncbi:hypothetical protein [Arthrobacter sp. R-11]|uniref:hypothetical protein n=1 Tax=Arthrobacter sp. R-11 TaxID=3404053 RepID=UPI003CF57977
MIVLVAAGILTSSTSVAYARRPRRPRSRRALTRRRKADSGYLAESFVALVALAAVTLAIHIQLGAAF